MQTPSAGPYRLAEAAEVLGVSDDTVRRWADQGRFETTRTATNALAINGADLARLATEVAEHPERSHPRTTSARNQLRGIVTAVKRDEVMAQVEMCCGPYRVVSLMSREAADDLDLHRGRIAVASVKSTNVIVALPS
ncbi:MAG: helix-turn-helix transcriptional regulator [Actinomycetota bacterium]|nr:helix-turn-helix transcriptional regulator [Actinomycetota bacterium]